MEVLVEVHKDQAEQMKSIVQTQMEAAFNYYAPSVPMSVDAVIGPHWIH